MHLNEAPAPAAAFCTAAENRFPLSLPAGEWSGTASAAQSQPSSNLQVFESSCRGVVWHGWRFFCCTLSAIFKSSSVLLGNIGGFPHHDITLMATLTIKQQLELKRLFLFVTNSSVKITLTTSSIAAKMGDTQSKSADRGEGE